MKNSPSQRCRNCDNSPAPKAFGAGFGDEMKIESREGRKKRTEAESALVFADCQFWR